jgi:hypothetical protein
MLLLRSMQSLREIEGRMQSEDSMKTRNGALCFHTGNDYSAVKRTDDQQRTYVRVQMYPPLPQRIEWVREENIVRGNKEVSVEPA